MNLTRVFLTNTTYAGIGLLLASAAKSSVLWADEWAEATESFLAPYLTGLRMAPTPATAYLAYRSKTVTNPATTTWVQLDLKKSVAIEAIQLFPAAEKWYPWRDQHYSGEGFPLRFKIEVADNEVFSQPRVIADFTQTDFPDPKDNITQHAAHGMHGRYVRVTATKLRAVRVLPPGGESAPQGEGIWNDHPHLVTDASTWKRAQLKAKVPKGDRAHKLGEVVASSSTCKMCCI